MHVPNFPATISHDGSAKLQFGPACSRGHDGGTRGARVLLLSAPSAATPDVVKATVRRNTTRHFIFDAPGRNRLRLRATSSNGHAGSHSASVRSKWRRQHQQPVCVAVAAGTAEGWTTVCGGMSVVSAAPLTRPYRLAKTTRTGCRWHWLRSQCGDHVREVPNAPPRPARPQQLLLRATKESSF